MQFRPHRGSLSDSMKECVTVHGRDGLIDHLRSIHPAYGPAFDPSGVHIQPYSGRDDRISWGQTFIVMQDGWGPIGFTDSDH